MNQITEGTLHQDSIWPSIEEKLIIESPIQVNVDGVDIEVDYKESIFSVNVNGTILEFLVNGTEIIQVNNSD